MDFDMDHKERDFFGEAGVNTPIPGPDPGACPDCGSWRKAGMIHECDTDAEQAPADGLRAAIAAYVAVVADEDASESAVLEADQALAEQIQRTDQAWEEIARLREFGEHYSGAAQEAWDRIVVLEKALREIAEEQQKTLGWIRAHGIVFDGPLGTDPTNWENVAFSIYADLCEVDTIARAALEGSASPGGGETS